MQTKRLTLTEYRQQNAVWLSNNLKGNSFENFIFQMYLRYLYAYGVSPKDVHIIEQKCNKFYDDKLLTIQITSEQIEEIIADEVKHPIDY